MIVLGINAYHGDASAAIVVDGLLVAAAEEERFNRLKHAAGFPAAAARYCLEAAGVGIGDVDHIAVSHNPHAYLARKILFAVSRRPRVLRDRITHAVRIRDIRPALAESLDVDVRAVRARQHRVEHHRSHMASAFLVSPFEEAACLSIDGFGDFLSAMWGHGRGVDIRVTGKVMFPHSVGTFYTAITQYLGFSSYGDEYKVMGLAPYGEPEFLPEFRRILQTDGSGYRLDLDYFLHHTAGIAMTWDSGQPVIGRIYSDALVRRFGSARGRDEPIEQRHRNLAASLQAVTEEVYFWLLDRLHRQTGARALCLAGGVAFNSVANGKIRSHTPFTDVYIQPAAGDAGTAIGAAFDTWHRALGRPRAFVMNHAYWGPTFNDEVARVEVRQRAAELRDRGCTVSECGDPDVLCRHTADALAQGRIVGWFQGRMEWGPRALGNRSILADPRRAEMKDILNARIKRREPFRPFCPSIVAERAPDYFDGSYPDPFMITVYPVRADKRAEIPAVTHIDGTGRLQTVTADTNPLFHRLLCAFNARTGVPILLNTSFNENEPIVCRPAEALDCFLRTKMDMLVVGSLVIRRE
ncbi:MAG: carbamoyltransferase [Acidobacteria bacterium RIFCSPLOWO2_12_FULL_67_14]|nr:MAG: carbamoyltransferase [Acidobacteria bacterium RIFCSPLOWO2_02_FULL_67_21]OFW40103.1 MAG: carbamoyltransferase [Acidobacteria bacterium RIFCSPLOWO2_12_FULL_67_14]